MSTHGQISLWAVFPSPCDNKSFFAILYTNFSPSLWLTIILLCMQAYNTFLQILHTNHVCFSNYQEHLFLSLKSPQIICFPLFASNCVNSPIFSLCPPCSHCVSSAPLITQKHLKRYIEMYKAYTVLDLLWTYIYFTQLLPPACWLALPLSVLSPAYTHASTNQDVVMCTHK